MFTSLAKSSLVVVVQCRGCILKICRCRPSTRTRCTPSWPCSSLSDVILRRRQGPGVVVVPAVLLVVVVLRHGHVKNQFDMPTGIAPESSTPSPTSSTRAKVVYVGLLTRKHLSSCNHNCCQKRKRSLYIKLLQIFIRLE
jgi:hypothetical protein